MDLVGKVLGNRYEILEKIGTGGMATVYKARCRVLNRFVAVKVLKDEFANDAEFIKRFQVEAQSAASLSHQNIVSVFDVGNDDGLHYIVMELVEGKTLKEIIKEKGILPWKDAVKIAAQIAAGLNQAHKNNIIHRDIKPHNIIITKDGIAKVTDFGIAKAVSNSTINAFGSTIGSVHYFSPEHARGGYTDEKSDIYSLGVVLYEMCTGTLPFDAETPVSVALKHMQEAPTEPKELNAEIPQALNDIILKAMNKDSSQRYASAQAMYNDLTKVLKDPDDITLKNVNIIGDKEFPTQKIPVVGGNITNDENIRNSNKKNIYNEQDDEKMSRKKGLTKSQALLRMFLIILIAIAVFFLCFKGGVALSEWIFGTDTTTEVPNIVGDSLEEAQRVLEERGLKLEVEANVENEEYPEGYVVYQSYGEGFRLKAGETVGVRVSKGANKVKVPDIMTLSSLTAVKMKIENSGLVYVEAFDFSDTIPSGDIIKQEPEADTEVDKDSNVTVYISMGPESGDTGLVKVPSVVGETEARATEILNKAKLLVKTQYVNIATKEDGIVISQAPEADVYQAELSEIVLVINKLSNKDDNTPSSGDEDKTDDKNNSGDNPGSPKRIVTINVSNATREKVNVKVVLESNVYGKRIEYEAEHSRNEGSIQVPVEDIAGAMVRVYFDDVVVSELPL